jgi:tRNA (guanine-N7-)-methyltransferase
VTAGSEHPRSIRSFVTRTGRITAAQQRALSELWPRYGIDFAAEALDPLRVFGRSAPCCVEIGFGNGEHLLALAQRQPQRDFLGVEVHRPGVGRLLLGLAEHALDNVRIICHDAVEVFATQLRADTLAEILVLFPDPWPKKRHHKRRLLQPQFASLLASRLAPGGMLRLATDWEPYAHEMLATLSATAQLTNAASGNAFACHPAERTPTRFERRGTRLGHEVFDLTFRRV